jgi:hypothetical protein
MRSGPFVLALALPLGSCMAGDERSSGEEAASEETSGFMEDPTCMLQGDLELELGQGEKEFSALAPGELPELFWGLQGGQHMWMAIRVKNPDLEDQQLAITIDVEYCNSNCEDESNWTVDNHRELLADETTLAITPEGWFEQCRMLVTVFGYVDAAYQRVEMTVTDPCGRQGVVSTSSFP